MLVSHGPTTQNFLLLMVVLVVVAHTIYEGRHMQEAIQSMSIFYHLLYVSRI